MLCFPFLINLDFLGHDVSNLGVDLPRVVGTIILKFARQRVGRLEESTALGKQILRNDWDHLSALTGSSLGKILDPLSNHLLQDCLAFFLSAQIQRGTATDDYVAMRRDLGPQNEGAFIDGLGCLASGHLAVC